MKLTDVRDILSFAKSVIFAATEVGPYVWTALTSEWIDISGLAAPDQTYWSLEYVPEINTARFGSGLEPEEQSLINIHQYGHMMLIEFPMLIPLSNTETFEIELYQK